MIKLRYILLLALISYTLQDIHCLVSAEHCAENDDDDEDRDSGNIDHCINEQEGKCHGCDDGYAVSHNRESCISSQNCKYLEEDNQKCKECADHYHRNSEGKCEGTLCEQYKSEDSNECLLCFSGYYLKDNECKRITIPYCIKVDETDENKCTICVDHLADPVDGKCIAPTTWIKGCDKYDTNGKCTKCDKDYTKNGDTCNFKSCPTGTTKVELCDVCEAGFTGDYDGWCIGHDGTKDTSTANGVKFNLALLLFILAILI